AEFEAFCRESGWLQDYVLFMAIKEAHSGVGWHEWPDELAQRRPEAMERAAERLADPMNERRYMQWQFFRQWRRVKEHANSRGIEIFGDIPIFVAGDSVDVWANPHLFHLDEQRRPTVVAGVPPDYFSATGQLWGNPLYDWKACREEGYRWWIERIRASHGLYDIIRIDHFRGFAAYWEVPAGETTAVNGRWALGPGAELFQALAAALGELPIVAEDLGTITPDVEELREAFLFPGMKVLQFAFDSGPGNPYLPHNHVQDMVVYTGTHDNDTTLGWYMSQSEHQKQRIRNYLNISGDDLVWDMIRAAMASVCDRAVIPLQDVLCLGTEAKMNRPGTARGNWSWRYREGDLTSWHAERLRDLSATYGRTGF
ncbi:MAG TPA: 4-alpha-glucanotransferase, partial [Verrucomicrobiae bacterium]|nr:4-alpha-glucanotransferase [Verrucomicrobiae bacterium]